MKPEEASKDLRVQTVDRVLAGFPPGRIVEVLNDLEARVQYDGKNYTEREILARLYKLN